METNPKGRSWRNRPRRIYALMAAIVVSVVAIAVFLAAPSIGLGPTPSTTTASILTGIQVVKPSNFIYSTFSLGDRYLSNYLIGNFTSTGSGGDNGIRLILFNETNFQTFQNTGIAVGVLYETGLVSSGSLDVKLPQTNTQYVVVFDNSMDSSNSKTISGNLDVVSSNPQ